MYACRLTYIAQFVGRHWLTLAWVFAVLSSTFIYCWVSATLPLFSEQNEPPGCQLKPFCIRLLPLQSLNLICCHNQWTKTNKNNKKVNCIDPRFCTRDIGKCTKCKVKRNNDVYYQRIEKQECPVPKISPFYYLCLESNNSSLGHNREL